MGFLSKYYPTGKMYADFFTKQLLGATFQKFRAMMQEITQRSPDVDMIWTRSTAKVSSQECVVNIYIKTWRKSTASMDARRGT